MSCLPSSNLHPRVVILDDRGLAYEDPEERSEFLNGITLDLLNLFKNSILHFAPKIRLFMPNPPVILRLTDFHQPKCFTAAELLRHMDSSNSNLDSTLSQTLVSLEKVAELKSIHDITRGKMFPPRNGSKVSLAEVTFLRDFYLLIFNTESESNQCITKMIMTSATCYL